MAPSFLLLFSTIAFWRTAALVTNPRAIPDALEPGSLTRDASDASAKEVDEAFECADVYNFSALESNGTKLHKPYCIGDRAVPRVYLLGVQKAGTKTLTVDLYGAGLKSARFNRPEIHAFDDGCRFNVPNRQSAEEANGRAASSRCGTFGEQEIDAWAHHFEHCTNESGPVLGDMTPINLRLPDLPATMANVYGSSHSKKLVFIVTLRSPMARLQSGFYHVLETCNGNVKQSPMFKNFQKYVNYAMEEVPKCDKSSSCKIDQSYPLDQFYRSMYGTQLEPWLQQFDPSQFVVMPMVQYFSDLKTRKSWVGSISDKFDLGLNADSIQNLGCHNSRSHPSLEHDLDGNSMRWLHDYYMADKQKLGKLLSENIPKGLTLMGYSGDGSADNVLSYLSDNW